jgi:hypothetical protein
MKNDTSKFSLLLLVSLTMLINIHWQISPQIEMFLMVYSGVGEKKKLEAENLVSAPENSLMLIPNLKQKSGGQTTLHSVVGIYQSLN